MNTKKLTMIQAIEARRRFREDPRASLRSLAEEYGSSYQAMSKLVNYRLYTPCLKIQVTDQTYLSLNAAAESQGIPLDNLLKIILDTYLSVASKPKGRGDPAPQ